MSTATLHYVYDPLCGWCYGASPLVQVARDTVRVQAHGGGMMAGAARRAITPELRQFVMTHDRRIAQASGQAFGQGYIEGLLRDHGAVLDSAPPITAVLAADLLGFGPDDEANLIATFREIAAMDMNDGIVFDPGSVKAEAIREDNTYGGTRITLVARIGTARCALQIDVGFGDAVTPDPQTVTYPTLLKDFQAPTLRVYPVYTVIAEKYQAMVKLGQANSRMKDFYDLAVIARRTELDGVTLAAAIAATFARRQTPLPTERPLALTN